MVIQIDTKTLYEQDFCLWAKKITDLLKNRQLEQLDYENLIEEIESMSGSQRQALSSNLRVLLVHLLKWKYQPNKRTNSWSSSIIEHCSRLLDAFDNSPSLKRHFEKVLDPSYQTARKIAAKETGLSITIFPVENPFKVEDILNPDYLPED